MADLSDNPSTALPIATGAAARYLSDHPEDFRGAIGYAKYAVRKEGLLSNATKEQAQKLAGLTEAYHVAQVQPEE